MFITRECDYAVRVVRALWGESRLSVSDICEKEAITAPFAYKFHLFADTGQPDRDIFL